MPTMQQWRTSVNAANGVRDWRRVLSDGSLYRPRTCGCDARYELAQPPEDLAYWLTVCPSCRPQVEAAQGKPYVEGVGFYAGGSGYTPPSSAKPITYTPPPPPPAAVPATPPAGPMIYPGPLVSSAQEVAPMISTSISPSATGILGTIGTAVGGPVGGVVGTVVGTVLGGLGASRCPGPYNYNPATGGCDPKPGSFGPTTTGPGAQTIPTGQGPVPGATGVTSPAEYSTTGWTMGMDARGNAYAEPMLLSRLQRRCPSGFVLDSNGMCYRKGTPGLVREWKPGARPILSAQDAKTLRKIGSIQKRVRKAAATSGFTCKKR